MSTLCDLGSIVTCVLINPMCCWCLICLVLLQLRQCTAHKPNLGGCYPNASKHMVPLRYLLLVEIICQHIWVLTFHSCLQTHRKANKQQSPEGLTCAPDKVMEAAITENTPYKTIDVVSTLLSVFFLYEEILYCIYLYNHRLQIATSLLIVCS